MDKVGLVVEGGGTKIAYSAGVLECFLKHHIYFPYSVGISSGSEVLLAYVARQIPRLRVTSIDAASQKGAMGWRPFLKEGSLFGLEATNEYIEKHAPLDFMSFFGSETQMDIGVYNMETREVEYFGKPYVDADMTLVKASCALLLLAKPYSFQGHRYFDAGLVDMISIEQALRQGCDKVVVLSTKEKGYRRKPAPKWQLWLAKLVYHDPKIVEDLKNRHLNYEKQWSLVEQLEAEGKALVLRPQKNMGVTRYTTNPKKLEPWFELGYEETEARLDEIRKFCGIDSSETKQEEDYKEREEKELEFENSNLETITEKHPSASQPWLSTGEKMLAR